MTLFIRQWSVTVGTLRIDAPLRVAFEIERTTRPQPNKATIRLWNLTRQQQAQIETAETAGVQVAVGYRERGAETIFSGELFRARNRSQPPNLHTAVSLVDAVTTVEAKDGGRAYQAARVAQSFGPGVGVGTVLRALATALGVGVGNLEEVSRVAQAEAGGGTFPEGVVLTGQASRELTRILAALGLRWSVQHGVLQILRRGEALQTQAIRLSPESGLVGHVEVGSRGRVKATSLLTPDLWPGRHVVVDDDRVQGTYRARSVTYRGDSDAAEWYAQAELEPLGSGS